MAYIVLQEYEPHNFKRGDIVGMDKKFAKKLLKEGIIEALSVEEEQAAFDELRKEDNGTEL